MGRRSSVKALPGEIQEEIYRLIREGRTIQEILDVLRGLGVATISSSAMGRHKQHVDAQLARYRQAQETAKAWVGSLKENPEGRVGVMLSETIKLLAHRVAASMEESQEDPETRDIAMLAKASKDLAGADKINVDRVAKLREEIRREEQERLRQEMDALTQQAGTGGGLDIDTLRRVRQIYGLS